MAAHSFQAYKTRILQVICGLAVLAMGLYAVRHSMGGSARTIKSIAGLVGAVAVVLALGDRYWVLLPALQAFGIQLPGVRFSPQELGCLAVVGIRFVRLALHLERPGAFDRHLVPATLLISWIGFVFLLNPTGLYMFGSEMVGGRFYFQIVLSFLTLLSLSQLQLVEKDAKLLFHSLVAAVIVTALLTSFRGFSFASRSDALSNYQFIFALSVFMLLFSRWSLPELFCSHWRILLLVVSAAFSVYTGKRRVFGTVFFVPLLRSFLTGREKLLTAFLFALFVCLAGLVVAGDGAYYRLPRSATRALAVAFPKYRGGSITGLEDPFRKALHAEARRIVRENPWVGRKGFAMSVYDQHLIWIMGSRVSFEEGAASYGYGGSWHGAWYAFAADFGLPCVALWALFSFLVLRFAFFACREVVRGTYLPTCCRYYALSLFLSMIFSFSSGHSAYTITEWFTLYGLLIAMVRGYRKQWHPAAVPVPAGPDRGAVDLTSPV